MLIEHFTLCDFGSVYFQSTKEASQLEVAQAKLKAIGQIDLRKDFDVDRLNVIPEKFPPMSLESHLIDIDWRA